jgi:hypothetical protein
MIARAIDEFFVLGPDAPTILGLFTLCHKGDELVAGLDNRIVAIRNCFCAHASGLRLD